MLGNPRRDEEFIDAKQHLKILKVLSEGKGAKSHKFSSMHMGTYGYIRQHGVKQTTKKYGSRYSSHLIS